MLKLTRLSHGINRNRVLSFGPFPKSRDQSGRFGVLVPLFLEAKVDSRTPTWVRDLAIRLLWTLAALGLACAEPPPSERDADEFAHLLTQEGVYVDSVGVRNLAQGDTLVDHAPLVAIETTVKIPSTADGGEVFAWEFYAEELNPVKLIIVRDHADGEHFEIVGESETFVPARTGTNRHVLREPIPIRFKDMIGFMQPAAATLSFRNVKGWKTLIAARPLERPLMRRDHFAMYGWRYSLRVFWRSAAAAEEGA